MYLTITLDSYLLHLKLEDSLLRAREGRHVCFLHQGLEQAQGGADAFPAFAAGGLRLEPGHQHPDHQLVEGDHLGVAAGDQTGGNWILW